MISHQSPLGVASASVHFVFIQFELVVVSICARIRQVTDLFVIGDDDAFGLQLRRSLHRDALVGRMHPHLLILMQLIASLRWHVAVLNVDCVADVANLGSVLQMIRHSHLGRDRRLALQRTITRVRLIPLRLLVASHVVERLGDWGIHSLVAHLLEGSLLRSRCVLK